MMQSYINSLINKSMLNLYEPDLNPISAKSIINNVSKIDDLCNTSTDLEKLDKSHKKA